MCLSFSRRDVQLSALFDSYSKNEFPQRLLIEGASGVGKTTLCRYLVYEWARGNLTWGERFKLVFHIDMRMIHKKSKEIEDVLLEQCLPFSFKKSHDEIAAILRKHQKNVLFVLDGVDSQKPMNVMSVLSHDTNRYPDAAVIATIDSNLETHAILLHFDTRLMLVGLRHDEQKLVVENYSKLTQQRIELFDPLLKNLQAIDDNDTSTSKNSQAIKVLALNPMLCLCLCLVCEQKGNVDFTTASSLLQAFVVAVQRLYCRWYRDAVQQDAVLEKVTDGLAVLEQIAFNAAAGHTDIMQTESLIVQHDNKDFLNFGLLSVFVSGQRSRPIENCIFISLLLKDFLAARFVSRMNEQEFDDCVDRLVKDRYLHNVAVFLCGIHKSNDNDNGETMKKLFSTLAIQNLSDHADGSSFLDNRDVDSKPSSAGTNASTYSCSSVMSVTNPDGRLIDYKLSLECMNEYEGHNGTAEIMLGSLPTKLRMYRRDAVDHSLLGGLCRIIEANIAGVSELNLRLDHLGQYNVHTLHKLAAAIEKSKYITCLKLHWMNDALLAFFLRQVFGHNKSIRVLRITDDTGRKADSLSAAVWSDLRSARVGMCFVKQFSFSCCTNSALVSGMLRNMPHTLQEICLNHSVLNLISAQELAVKLENSHQLKTLNLRSARFSCVDLVHITRSLKHSRSLTELNLSHTGIEQNSIATLNDLLTFNKSICRIDLSRNPLNTETCQTLAATLRLNTSIIEVNLRECEIDQHGYAALKDRKRKTLTILGISPRRPASSFYNAVLGR